MTNAVYTTAVRALSGVVSERAADTMLRALLRDQGLEAGAVTAQEMQRVLSGPLLARLSAVLPPARARQELLALSRSLEAQYPKAPTLFTGEAPQASWDGPAAGAETTWDELELDENDFEFDDPDYAPAGTGRAYDLGTPLGQEALLQDLGKLGGVQGVMVCRASGEVLRMRAVREAPALGTLVAATARLLGTRRLRLLSAELGGRTVCMRPLGEHCVAVIASSQANVGRVLVELQQLRSAA